MTSKARLRSSPGALARAKTGCLAFTGSATAAEASRLMTHEGEAQSLSIASLINDITTFCVE